MKSWEFSHVSKSLCLSLVMSALVGCNASAGGNSLPVLNEIQEFTFSTPYSCSGSYETSALFLTEYSRSKNAPELLYDGACRSEDYVEASTGGDDFTLIADLGDIQLEDLTASKAFNWKNIVGFENTFKAAQAVTKNHTYAVLISKSDIRALYAFKVIDQIQDGAMTIRYVVKSYSIQHTDSESSGFDWEAKNNELEKNVKQGGGVDH